MRLGLPVDSSMQTKGAVPVSIVNLDLLYDRNWFGRWMTMEMKSPDDVIVHVAVARITAQIDVVRAGEARREVGREQPGEGKNERGEESPQHVCHSW